MKKVYLYPKVIPCENPYIMNLEKCLARYYTVINTVNKNIGVLDLVPYFFKTDIFYFNWIENLPSRKYGKIQIIFFVIILYLAGIFNKKVVWTLHNRYSHDKTSNAWSDFMYRFMVRKSDFIVTHSMAGVEFIKEEFPEFDKKVKYFVHPVIRSAARLPDGDKPYDLFIWGTIWPYKGVTDFLRFLKGSADSRIKVLIAGKAINEEVYQELKTCLTPDVTYINEFFEISEIAELAGTARYTLFTYKPESVLSSGSLMDSIGMGSIVIGPDVGAFRDLSIYPFVKVYDTFSEVLQMCEAIDTSGPSTTDDLDNFINGNSWEKFGDGLYNAFNEAMNLIADN